VSTGHDPAVGSGRADRPGPRLRGTGPA